jgi:Tfp pilus assembly protein PilX
MNQEMRSQRGTTLVIALIMLVLLTLFAVSAMNTSTINLKVVGNMQTRSEALAAAQASIEQVLSTSQFVADPNNAVINPCGAANTLCTDVTGDGVPEYITVLNPKPSCIEGRALKVSELNLTNSEDLSCAASQQQQFGVIGSTSGDSLCAVAVWDITAVTSSNVTGSSITLSQGVSTRVTADDLAAKCS